jgi:hypothetical protein
MIIFPTSVFIFTYINAIGSGGPPTFDDLVQTVRMKMDMDILILHVRQKYLLKPTT